VSAAAALLVDELVERVAVRVVELLGTHVSPPGEASPWLTVDEAAEYLRCKPKRIYDLVSQSREHDPGRRRLPVHRDGSRLLFLRHELDAYLLDGHGGADTDWNPSTNILQMSRLRPEADQRSAGQRTRCRMTPVRPRNDTTYA
jgi:excisionase family DNA binding protein